MGQLVLLVISVLERDEDAQIVRSGHDAHACPGEFCAQLIVTSRADALLGAFYVEGGDGRVVGSLFGEVRDGDGLAVAGEAVRAARGSRGWRLEGWVGIFNLPVTLSRVSRVPRRAEGVTYAEELAQC
jgi:hypothetical protein